MPTIGVIIVSYNTRELLRACLASLRDCTLPLRVVVVDSASSDDSAAMVRSDFPEVCLLEPGRNVGFAAGNNLGLAQVLSSQFLVLSSTGSNSKLKTQNSDVDYVLLLNPDTVVHPGAIETLAAFLEAHPRVGAVGPRLLNPDGSVQTAAFRFPTLLMTLFDLFPPGEVLPGRLYNSWWHGRYPQEREGCAPFPIDHPLGACILARRAAIEQIGGLDEAFFMYAEEVDWCLRLQRAGWAIWQAPEARVTHVGGASTSQFRTRMLIALYESRQRFFRKHYSARFVRWNARIVRTGMLRASMSAWRDYRAGRLDRDELRARLWAYGEVM
ncbi:MAG TPA: glycosyltransferase family 2 protein, partial [Roseiflexaceae bacterium]|nr:glycosyltransferase family 2 protein [Roseiflexaceae bacterium]